MNGKCESCKHWAPSEVEETDSVLNPIDWSKYMDGANEIEARIPQPHEVGYCMNPRLLFFERPAKDGAALFDGSEYHARLVTGPEWGCVQHELRETEES